jgi:hypothetical protein
LRIWSSFASRTDVHKHRLKPIAGNSARDWLQLGPVAASEVLLALAVPLGQSASGAAVPTFTFDDLLLWSETLDGEDRSAAISQEGKAPTRPVQMDRH